MRSCFCGSGQAWRSLEVEPSRCGRQLCFHSFILAPFAFGARLLVSSLHPLVAFYSSRRDTLPRNSLPAPSSSSTVRYHCALYNQVQIALTLSQTLTFSHARSSPCLVASSPGHSVFSHSSEFPNKINAHLNASVERASSESSFALRARPYCWCAGAEVIQVQASEQGYARLRD